MLPWHRCRTAPPSHRAAVAPRCRRTALPPHRATTTHIALPPHRVALPPVIPILSLHNPVVQRE